MGTSGSVKVGLETRLQDSTLVCGITRDFPEMCTSDIVIRCFVLVLKRKTAKQIIVRSMFEEDYQVVEVKAQPEK